MKNLYLFIALLALNISASAQITIISSDMPSPNDSIRMSSALNASLYNFATTDTNYNWDFSQLIAASQRSERFMSVSSTPIIYNIVFYSKSNLASKRDDMSILNINITDGYNFYNNSTADYRQVGYGASVNGSPIPVSFKSDDVIYRFPVAYSNIDSSDSEWEVNIPNLAYINEKIHRVNTVDGWGTITTPYGTFQCVRLKSEVLQDDTIFYTSTNMGLRLPQTYTEYIWLSKTLPFPILKATVPQIGGAATVEYCDSARQFVSIEQSSTESIQFDLYPNPSNSGFEIKVANKTQQLAHLRISDMQGKLIFSMDFIGDLHKHFPKNNLNAGLYLIQVETATSIITKKLIIQ